MEVHHKSRGRRICAGYTSGDLQIGGLALRHYQENAQPLRDKMQTEVHASADVVFDETR